MSTRLDPKNGLNDSRLISILLENSPQKAQRTAARVERNRGKGGGRDWADQGAAQGAWKGFSRRSLNNLDSLDSIQSISLKNVFPVSLPLFPICQITALAWAFTS